MRRQLACRWPRLRNLATIPTSVGQRSRGARGVSGSSQVLTRSSGRCTLEHVSARKVVGLLVVPATLVATAVVVPLALYEINLVLRSMFPTGDMAGAVGGLALVLLGAGIVWMVRITRTTE